MSDNQQPEWPKSFRWKGGGSPAVVTFYSPTAIGVLQTTRISECNWTLEQCESSGSEMWEPVATQQHKPAPAASEDNVKAKVAAAIKSVRRHIQNSSDSYINDDGRVMYLRDAISELADAVERLAK